jgi:phosphohistidine phosphatase
MAETRSVSKTLITLGMNEIYILRHGHAQNPDNDLDDFDRALTDEGIEKTTKLSLFFSKLDINLELVLSSPYIRAKQTAEIFTSNLTPKPAIKTVDFLACGASSKEISRGLMDYSSNKNTLLIGHSPDLEVFLGKLIGADKVMLKKGALAKVNFQNNIELSGELEWLITPKLVKQFKIKI